MQTLTEIKQLLESHGLAPDKSFGQNFLCDHNLIRRLVDESGVRAGDLVLEIGPGTGALTDELVERGCEVIACEIDRGLAALLRDRFAEKITLVEGDALHGKHELNPEVVAAIGGRSFRLVANLPYGVASPLMVMLATRCAPGASPACLGQFVTIQKEVGERLRAKPGTEDYSELSVLVQAMGVVRRVAVLPPECFWPRPKVTSEMVSIVPRSLAGEKAVTSDPARLAAACRLLFGQRRKQIGSILGRETIERLAPLPAGVEPNSRAETLSIEQLEALAVRLGEIKAF
ncbi:MAG TPA: 16S rRNA (adenine(1518)-N(6)/adenine(1519)-N(6))-dimethyltransferase RsmA [Phycisphaerales bacterium]|nr:16S rRNA (adenine(1518)-N(6)/adenine(1519)-N(6))-dimethyltransferase RsmA [Phycisphaerales bacterium]